MGLRGVAAPAGGIATTVITGFSGAGKSTALKVLEDQGYYCVDNLPVFMLSELLGSLAARYPSIKRLAVVMDCRDPSFPASHPEVFTRLRAEGRLRILFLSADEKVLLKRYSQLRRVHPLAAADSPREGIRREGALLASLQATAEKVFDTSEFTPHELRAQLLQWLDGADEPPLQISLMSFGFKHGPPEEADLVLDVRFLPNPYFQPLLSEKSGLQDDVAAFVLQNEQARRFFELLRPLLFFLVPAYRREGKKYLTIAIGCTGGRHRSVAVAEEITRMLGAAGEKVRASHRDLNRS